jgi:hypothetical protein
MSEQGHMLDEIIGVLERIADHSLLKEERLRQIETPLALLDGGPDTSAALAEAYAAANRRRFEAGMTKLKFELPAAEDVDG